MKKLIYCPKCKENNETIYYIYPIFHSNKEAGEECVIKDCDGIYEEIDFPYDDMKYLIMNTSDDINFLEAMIDLRQKDPIEYQSRMSQFKAQVRARDKEKKERKEAEKLPKCSYCGSTNIQVVRRKWSLVTGFMTNKTDRICANCGRKL